MHLNYAPKDPRYAFAPGWHAIVTRRAGAVLGAFLITLVASTDLFADSFRCGRKLIRTGDSSEVLRQRCGEPRGRDSGQEELWLQGNLQKIHVERWYYKQGSRSLERIVLVYRGTIVGIRTGGR